MSKYSAEIAEIISLVAILNEDNAGVLVENGMMDGNGNATKKGLTFLKQLKSAKTAMNDLKDAFK
ncbi:hypothetical protein BegalDRAFT_1456 [Beggiatoa alba B18LD]|uniref:Uncharacterized protein n=1 Tax=Beggiatoa alba B18LD TaxID=395493 RepID=I3CFF1_9GAMM|nr:hypothetical protein [Beggiatoa alba]EIJ42344.1 hypothetical protein BegalDRAFT_1456 [Beggiatoa alba B18LD]